MATVKSLIWDDWNKEHVSKHDVTIEEAEDVCHGKHQTIKSYRKRLQLVGKTRLGRVLAVVLSHQDRNLEEYPKGVYYIITAYEKGVKDDKKTI